MIADTPIAIHPTERCPDCRNALQIRLASGNRVLLSCVSCGCLLHGDETAQGLKVVRYKRIHQSELTPAQKMAIVDAVFSAASETKPTNDEK